MNQYEKFGKIRHRKIKTIKKIKKLKNYKNIKQSSKKKYFFPSGKKNYLIPLCSVKYINFLLNETRFVIAIGYQPLEMPAKLLCLEKVK